MALEDAIKELNENVLKLITVFSTAASPFPQPGSDASPVNGDGTPKNKGGRPTKAEAEAKKAAEAAAAAGQKIAETGDPMGTKYFWNAAHNVAFSVKPGEKMPDGVTATEIPAAEFVAKRNATQQTAPQTGAADPFAENASAAGGDPFAETAAPAPPPAKPKTQEEVVAHLRKLNEKQGKGKDAVMRVLNQFGAVNVGGLVGKNQDEVYAAIEKELQS